ncbi:MAG: bifunctional folylpolyglutamate synthase/dihydrofolate synthase [Acholeplasmataceae bacterium]|jgi:dihydrofolate synthase/folylpolyglutamate synthase
MTNNLELLIKTLETQISKNPKNNMKRVEEAIRFFSLDFSNMKKIHVGGTNGKGSTCKYLTEILTLQGYKVGTFVSPYLKVFNERILLNNNLISDEHLEKYIKIVLDYNESRDEKMSFFELLTVLAFKYFFDQQVEIMIIEVGIGGKLDVTNTINYDLSLLTNIGTDHLDRLGPTELDVLYNKLGILKPNGVMLTTIDSKHHNRALEYANLRNAQIFFIDKPIKLNDNPLTFTFNENVYQLQMIGEYQLLNAALSISAINYLCPNISYEIIKKGLYNAKWPGRLELINKQPDIYIDAAHNKEAAIALRESIEILFGNKKLISIISLLKGKDYHSFINEVSKFSKKIILTSFPDPRLADLNQIINDFPNVELVTNFNEAIQIINNPCEVYLITGSIHFLGYFLNNFKK